jgi:RNA polymerase sigma-70 factor, ECF subfamily
VATPLRDLVAARAPDAAASLGDDAELTLAALCSEAAAAWPEVIVEPAAVIAALADKLAGDDPPPITAAGLAEIHLALACVRGDAAALVAFDRGYLEVVPAALAGMQLPAATVDDVRATVRDKLLLGDAPKLVDYAGRGRLRGLVQVIATRAAIDRIRAEEREVELPADHRLVAPGDVEMSLIKEQYRDAFAAGFARAVAGLPRRDRNLMRLHFLGGVTLDQLAQIYGVHRATVVRWLAAARAVVLEATRGHVATAIGAPDDELDDMFALVASRVELSLDRLLATIERSGPHL